MKKLLLVHLGTLLFLQSLSPQIVLKEPLSYRLAGYNIDAKLDHVTKTVEAKMKAFWVNSSRDVVPDIQLHLYMNAFRSSKTIFNIESGDSPTDKKPEYGWINIKSFTDQKGKDLIPRMEYISSDDGNMEDQTVLRVVLPKPAVPGDTVFINVSFETRLPSEIIRTGYSDDFYFVAQWFPKFGVYEPAGMRYAKTGGWNCHQFHANSEFYSNHSVYDVKITLPKEYIVGSRGMLIDEVDSDGDKKQN